MSKKIDTIIYFICPDYDIPSGGIKKLYDQVDILNNNGFSCSILHENLGFRCSWFENVTEISYKNNVKIDSSNILVIPEIYSQELSTIYPGIRKVIYCQNAYNIFKELPSYKYVNLSSNYLQKDNMLTIVTSKHDYDYLTYLFPNYPVFRIHYGIDSSIFNYGTSKKKIISFMPRKLEEDSKHLLNILSVKGYAKDFIFKPIDNMNFKEVGEVLKETQIFLSFSKDEGFGLPPIEAMACGNVVIGYHGNAGKEYFKNDFAFPIEYNDVITFSKTIECLINADKQNENYLNELGIKASDFVLNNYSKILEEHEILKLWSEIIIM